MSKKEMVALIETMNNYDELAAKAKAKADAIREAIKEEMVRLDTEELTAGAYIVRGLSQILCNHREVVKNRVKILKGGSGISCCRLVYKITAVNGHVKGGGVSLHSS